jgi:hypothetical protein
VAIVASHRNRCVKRPEIKHFLVSHFFTRICAPSSNFKLRNMILPILLGRSIYSAGGGLTYQTSSPYFPLLKVGAATYDHAGQQIKAKFHNLSVAQLKRLAISPTIYQLPSSGGYQSLPKDANEHLQHSCKLAKLHSPFAWRLLPVRYLHVPRSSYNIAAD